MARKAQPDASRKDLTKKTMVGFFWQTSATGVSTLLQFIVLIVLSRLLLPSQVGLINIAYIVISFAELFYQFGIGPSIIQRKDLNNNHIRSAFTLTIILGTLLSAVVWLLAPFFATFFKDATGLTDILRGLAFLFAINSTGLVARSLNYRNLNYRIKTIFQVSSYTVGYGVVGIGLAALGFGSWSLVWAALVQAVLINVLFISASRHDMRPMLDIPALSELLNFGAGITLGSVLNRVAANVDNIIVGNRMGATNVGIYGRAFQLVTLPNMIFGNILDAVLFTAMSKVQDEPKTLRAIYRRGASLMALLVMPLSAAFFIFAPETIRVLYGSRWDAVVLPFQVFAGTMVFRTGYRMSDMVSRATGTVYKRAARQAIYALMVMVGAWVGHRWGVVGVAAGVSIASILNFFLMAQLTLQITHMSMLELLKIHIPTAFLTLVTLAESWLLATALRSLNLPDLLILAIGGSIIFASCVALCWLAPKTFLGQEGEWIANTLLSYLPPRFKHRFVRSAA